MVTSITIEGPIQIKWAAVRSRVAGKPHCRPVEKPKVSVITPHPIHLEKGMATHSSTLAMGESHGQRRPVGYSPQGHEESDMAEAT